MIYPRQYSIYLKGTILGSWFGGCKLRRRPDVLASGDFFVRPTPRLDLGHTITAVLKTLVQLPVAMAWPPCI